MTIEEVKKAIEKGNWIEVETGKWENKVDFERNQYIRFKIGIMQYTVARPDTRGLISFDKLIEAKQFIHQNAITCTKDN